MSNLLILDEMHGIFLNTVKCLALLASILTITILSRPSSGKKKNLHKMLLVMSVADLVYIASLILTAASSYMCFTQRSSLRKANKSGNLLSCLVYSLFFIDFGEYLSSVMLTFNTLYLIYLKIRNMSRLLSSSKDKFNKLECFRKAEPLVSSLVILVVSSGVFSPLLFINKVQAVKVSGSNVTRVYYTPTRTEFGRRGEANEIIDALSVLRIVLSVVVMSLVNAVAIWQFKSHFKHIESCNFAIIYFVLAPAKKNRI
jgi:hypothetical protein